MESIHYIQIKHAPNVYILGFHGVCIIDNKQNEAGKGNAHDVNVLGVLSNVKVENNGASDGSTKPGKNYNEEKYEIYVSTSGSDILGD